MGRQTASSVSTERTNMLLRQALFSLLMTKPFEKISLTDICKLAMIPRSTFYRHFEDKFALLCHCFDEILQDAKLIVDIGIMQSREQTRDFFIGLFSYLKKHKPTYRKMIMNNRQSGLIDYLREYLEKLMRDNIIETFHNQVPNGLPADMFAKIVTGVIISAGESYIDSEADYDIEELADRIALCTDEGLLAVHIQK